MKYLPVTLAGIAVAAGLVATLVVFGAVVDVLVGVGIAAVAFIGFACNHLLEI